MFHFATPHAFGSVSPPSPDAPTPGDTVVFHPVTIIKIAFAEGHPTSNLIPSVTIVIGLGILLITDGSYMEDFHAS